MSGRLAGCWWTGVSAGQGGGGGRGVGVRRGAQCR